MAFYYSTNIFYYHHFESLLMLHLKLDKNNVSDYEITHPIDLRKLVLSVDYRFLYLLFILLTFYSTQ